METPESIKLAEIHPFFALSPQARRGFQVKLAGAVILFNLLAIGLAVGLGWYGLPIFSLWISLSIIAPFFDVPSLIKQGQLRLYSSMFLIQHPEKDPVIMHGGTLLEYYFALDRSLPASQRTSWILLQYIRGLLAFLEDVDRKGWHSKKLKGTSYILNERTAQKIGLNPTKLDFGQTFILWFNLPNMMVAYSLSKGKLRFPPLWRVRSFEGNMLEISKNKARLELLAQGLERRLRKG
ncbi:MAG: hypothetical protein AAFR61_14505 [Bacteroidota bacterium]